MGKLAKEKYFKGTKPMHWLRVGPRLFSSGLTISKNLIKSIPFISNDLSWKFDRGIHMFLGIDLIYGVGE